MPYSPQHKQKSRIRILESAYRLFIRRGYELTSIDEVMHQAELTRGAFYAHFGSKQELYREAIRHAAVQSYIAEPKPEEMEGSDWLNHLLEIYLSTPHVRFKGRPCPLASLVTDVSVREPGIRDVYTQSFKGFNEIMNRYLGGEQGITRTTLSVSAMMIGAVAISRAIRDKDLSEELLDSCRTTAAELLCLGGEGSIEED